MACVLKEKNNLQFQGPGNLKVVAGFKILTELYQFLPANSWLVGVICLSC